MPETNESPLYDTLVTENDRQPVAQADTQLATATVAPLVDRIAKLPRDVGWMLFGVGFAGFVAPGIFGLPFMAAGGLILWPKTTHRLQGLLGRKAPEKTIATGMRQIERFLDDLERRYPKTGHR